MPIGYVIIGQIYLKKKERNYKIDSIMAYFPMFIDLQEQKCLIAGGGVVALRKVRVLLDFGAAVTVVAPKIDARIKAYAPKVTLAERPFQEEDLNGCVLVVAATDDKTVNHAIAQLAQEKHIRVNAVDQQEDCTFIFPSYVKKQDLVGAYSSAGNSPVITQYLKAASEEFLTDALGEINAYMGSIRPLVKKRIADEPLRRRVYVQVLNKLLSEGRTALLPEELEEILIRQTT